MREQTTGRFVQDPGKSRLRLKKQSVSTGRFFSSYCSFRRKWIPRYSLSSHAAVYLKSPRFFFSPAGAMPFIASSKRRSASFCSSFNFSGTETTSVT